jgi:uncharacterized protein with GYD domain
MPTYILLGNFTEQGIRAIKDTTKRAEALRQMGGKLGVTVKETYWTLGRYDVALIADASNDEAMSTFGLSIGALGNVRTEILRAFTPGEIGPILSRII